MSCLNCPFQDGDVWIWCPKHQVKKYRRDVELCRRRGSDWQAWEEGRGRRQIGFTKQKPPKKKPGGPGTELRKIIKKWQTRLPWFNLTEYPGCKCGETARLMDEWGPAGCRRRMGELVDRLEEEARRRHLSVPFRARIAERMIMKAITASEAKGH